MKLLPILIDVGVVIAWIALSSTANFDVEMQRVEKSIVVSAQPKHVTNVFRL